MKFLIVTAALVAVAVAGPTQRFVLPGIPIARPPIVDSFEPIHIGPALVEDTYEPIHIGPAIVEDSYEPIHVGPAIIENPPQAPVPSSPLVQIIVNVNKDGQVVGAEVAPSPVEIVESPIGDEIEPTPVDVVDVAPVEIDTPVFPAPMPIPLPGLPLPLPALPSRPVLRP